MLIFSVSFQFYRMISEENPSQARGHASTRKSPYHAFRCDGGGPGHGKRGAGPGCVKQRCSPSAAAAPGLPRLQWHRSSSRSLGVSRLGDRLYTETRLVAGVASSCQRAVGTHQKTWYLFSICACHPCAGAMLIFSVSFQFYRMISEENPINLVFRT